MNHNKTSQHRSNMHNVPVIDLDLIDESKLVALVRSIVLHNDTFLIRNFAGQNVINDLCNELSTSAIPDTTQKFDSNFTGVLVDDDYTVEQYIVNTDDSLHFDRDCENVVLRKLYNRLFKVSLYFTQIVLKSLNIDIHLDETSHGSKITRFYNSHSTIDPNQNNLLPDGEKFQYFFQPNYKTITSDGLLTVIPMATAIRCKPPTNSVNDNQWILIDEPNCLMFHTGDLLSKLSNGLHSTAPFQLDPLQNVIHLTVYPPFVTKLPDNASENIGSHILKTQIKEFPKVAQKFYRNQQMWDELTTKIAFYKDLFTITETVLSLYAISRVSIGQSPELHSLLPQMSNMIKTKITEDVFLRLLTIWPEAYNVQANSNQELTVSLPKIDTLAALTNKSRRLQFAERADSYLARFKSVSQIPNDVEAYKFTKRRSSNTATRPSLFQKSVQDSPVKRVNSYISNSSEKFVYKEKQHTSQTDLLQKLREKEKRSMTLIEQRQKQYQMFLAVKMTQLYDIIYSLPWKTPYTSTHLSALIVDSLQDSNNPIGASEAEEIMVKLQSLLPHQISMRTVDGGLKVFRWDNLNRTQFQEVLLKYKSDTPKTGFVI